MVISQIEKNLPLLFCQSRNNLSGKWVFNDKFSIFSIFFHKNSSQDYCYVFERKRIFKYLACSLLFWLMIPPQKKSFKIYYLQDNLMSMIFPPKSTVGYRYFAKNHLSVKTGLGSRVKNCLPVLLTADKRYIFVPGNSNGVEVDHFSDFDFMFFSNPTGKILMTTTKTLQEGKGVIAKTTANVNYISTLVREAETVSTITNHAVMKNKVPYIFNKENKQEKCFIFEEYLEGVTLREIIRSPQVFGDFDVMEKYIDQLNNWFLTYRSIFEGTVQTLDELYAPLFLKCAKYYSDDITTMSYVLNLKEELKVVSASYPGLTPIISHNDLWPGNFLETKNGLVAIDWERSTSNSAEIFDFFWMLISTALEYAIASAKLDNYSEAFRYFLNADNPICLYVFDLLNKYLHNLGLNENLMPLFLNLFLLEWSVQGKMAFNKETEMDKIAFVEFINYYQVNRETVPASGPLAKS